MTDEECARLLALVEDWDKGAAKFPTVSAYDEGQRDTLIICSRQLREAARLPPRKD